MVRNVKLLEEMGSQITWPFLTADIRIIQKIIILILQIGKQVKEGEVTCLRVYRYYDRVRKLNLNVLIQALMLFILILMPSKESLKVERLCFESKKREEGVVKYIAFGLCF